MLIDRKLHSQYHIDRKLISLYVEGCDISSSENMGLLNVKL